MLSLQMPLVTCDTTKMSLNIASVTVPLSAAMTSKLSFLISDMKQSFVIIDGKMGFDDKSVIRLSEETTEMDNSTMYCLTL